MAHAAHKHMYAEPIHSYFFHNIPNHAPLFYARDLCLTQQTVVDKIQSLSWNTAWTVTLPWSSGNKNVSLYLITAILTNCHCSHPWQSCVCKPWVDSNDRRVSLCLKWPKVQPNVALQTQWIFKWYSSFNSEQKTPCTASTSQQVFIGRKNS